MQIILKLTTACNLACSYCSEGNQEPMRLPEEFFYKLVGDIPEFCRETGETQIEFLFHGGEPLLYGREALHRLTAYAREHLPGIEVKFLMQSNGVLVDEDWIELFVRDKISVGVSLDGYPEIHDKYRRTKTGEPTAEKILENISTMRAAGLSVGTLMVVNSGEDVEVQKLFDFITKEKLHPKIHPVIPCGRAEGRMDSGEVYHYYTKLMEELCERLLTHDQREAIQPLDELLDAVLGVAPVRECSFNGSCGQSFICLYPDGEMGFCGRDNAARLLVYGNIAQKSLLALYQSANAEKIRARQEYLRQHDCQDCSDWELCHGGCAFEAIYLTGNLEAKYQECEARRELLSWMRTRGLSLLKETLIREKTKRRQELQRRKQLLTTISSLTLGEVEALARNNAP